MRTYIAEEQQTIEDGIYPAKVQKIEDAPEGQFGPAYKFIFDVEVDEEIVELSAFVSDPEHFTAKCKLRKWGGAILGHEIQDGEKFSPKMLIDKACRVLVKNEEKDNGTWAKIKDVMSASKPKPKKTKPETEEGTEDEIPF